MAGVDPALGLGAGTAAPTSTDPSGIPMPTGDLPGWKQIFADNFSSDENTPVGSFSNCNWGSTVDTSNCNGLSGQDATNWFAYPDNTCDTTCSGRYEPSQDVAIANNTMNINMHVDPTTGTPGVTAMEPKLKTTGGNGQVYGMYAVRFRTSSTQGYSLSFLLWPDDNVWPQHGEVDFPETDDQLGGNATAFMHWMGATSGGQQSIYNSNVSTADGWHTYVIEWTPSMIRFLIDGQTIGTATSHLPTDPMHWVLQTTTNLSGIAPITGQNGTIQIAWATAYSYDPSNI